MISIMSELEDNGKSYDSFHEMLESMGFKKVVVEEIQKIPKDKKVILFLSSDENLFRTLKRWVYKHEDLIIFRKDFQIPDKIQNLIAIIIDEDKMKNIPRHLQNLCIKSIADYDLIVNTLDEL